MKKPESRIKKPESRGVLGTFLTFLGFLIVLASTANEEITNPGIILLFIGVTMIFIGLIN